MYVYNYAFKLKPTAVWFEKFEETPALSHPSTFSRQKPKFNFDLKMLVNDIGSLFFNVVIVKRLQHVRGRQAKTSLDQICFLI